MKENVLDRIKIEQGDITKLEIDAIVNAANSSLLGGGGVDGAIHMAAGPELVAECRTIDGGCPTGEARITKGYQLPAKHVIHTVGPVYNGEPEESALLSGCYKNSLTLAEENNIESIAFPAISCGIFGYPVKDACKIAVDTSLDFLENNKTVQTVIFILFSDDDREIYEKYLSSLKR